MNPLKPLLIATSLLSSAAITGEWDYPANAPVANSAAEVLSYLNQHYAQQDGSNIEYELRYQSQSKTGKHYNFNVNMGGVYQPQKAMVVSTNGNDQIVRVYKSLQDTLLIDGKPIVAAELESPRTLVAEHPPTLASGALINAPIQVFSPDLRTMQQVPAPASLWPTLDDYPQAPDYLDKTVQLLKQGDHYYLANERVQQVDVEALLFTDPDSGKVIRDTSTFAKPEGITRFSSLNEIASVNLEHKAFAQLMAYFHLDQSLQYLQQLGYSLFTHPVKFDGQGQHIDNSSYFKGPAFAAFGGGASPDAIDADVVIHELGHGLHYQIVPDWAYGHTGALGEGIGDYWAGSYSYRVQYQNANRQGQEFELDTVFNWDGYFGTRATHRSLNNQKATYFESAEYRAHVSVAGELGDELWSTPLFQSLKQAVAQYGEPAFAEFDTLVLEGLYGIGRGVKMHDLAESTLYAAKTLYPNRDYAEILKQNFASHGLLKPPLLAHYQANYVALNQPISVHLSPTGRQVAIDGSWQVGQQQQAIQQGAFSELQLALSLTDPKLCGQALNASLTADLTYSADLLQRPWQHQTKIVAGLPELKTPAQQEDSFLPDATLDQFGRVQQRSKLFSFILKDEAASSGVVDQSFALYLQLEHENQSDLTVSLTSPKGTRVMLLQHPYHAQNSFSDFFTFAHDTELAALAGEPTKGTWLLEIIDSSHGNTGTLKRWGVSHYSHYSCNAPTPEQPNNNKGGGTTSPGWLVVLASALLCRVRRVFTPLFSDTLRVIQ